MLDENWSHCVTRFRKCYELLHGCTVQQYNILHIPQCFSNLKFPEDTFFKVVTVGKEKVISRPVVISSQASGQRNLLQNLKPRIVHLHVHYHEKESKNAVFGTVIPCSCIPWYLDLYSGLNFVLLVVVVEYGLPSSLT